MFKCKLFILSFIVSWSTEWSVAFEQVPKEYILHSFTDVNGRPKVTFTNLGDGKYSGALFSDAGQSSFDSLQVKNGLTVIGDASVRKLSVISHIDTSTLEIKTKLNAARIEASNAVTTNDLLAAYMRVNGIFNVTGEASINGQVIVGSLASRGRVEARTMIVSNDIKCQSMDSTGLVKSKDIEVQNSLKVLGQLHSLEASFQGDVLVAKKIKMNEAEVKTFVVTGSVDIPGIISCSGKLISKQMHTSGEVNMTGPVYMSDLRTKEIKVDGKASVALLNTDSLHTAGMNVGGPAFMKTANIDGDVTCEVLKVKSNATISSLLIVDVKVTKQLMIDGKLSINGQFDSNSDVVVNATINAQKVKVHQTISAKEVDVYDMIKAGKVLSVGDIETHKALVGDSLYLKDKGVMSTIEANSINVSKSIECQQMRSESIQASAINAQIIKVESDLRVGGAVVCNAGLHMETGMVSGNLTVNGAIEVKRSAWISSDLRVSNRIESETANISKLLTCHELNATESIRAQTAFIEGDFYIGKDKKHVSLMAKSGLFQISTNMTVDESATIRKGLIVHGPISAEIISASKELRASELCVVGNGDVCMANGTVTSTSGFVSPLGSVQTHTLKASNLVSSEKDIISFNITASNAVSSPSIYANALIAKTIHSQQVQIHEASLDMANITTLHVTKNCTLLGSVRVEGNIIVDEVEVSNGIKARSMFSSRIYTQDISASGFITADTVINKGDIKVHGRAEVNELAVTSVLTTAFAKITSSLECSAGTVLGTLDAAGVVTRKATVTGDLLLNGVNVAQALSDLDHLKERLAKLEDFVNKYFEQNLIN